MITKNKPLSVLTKTRNEETYFQKIMSKALGTQRLARFTFVNFKKFLNQEYQHSKLEDIIEEILVLKGQKREQAVFDLLQNYVNWLAKNKYGHSVIRNYFNRIKQYFFYRGIKIYNEDVQANIDFPKKIVDPKHPLTKEEIKKILHFATPSRRALYLFMLSAGTRPQETIRLRKSDIDPSHLRPTITIPGIFTKTKRGRKTYMSLEAWQIAKPIWDKSAPNDLIFGNNPDHDVANQNEELYFARVRSRAGLTEKYESGTHKITLQSFRAWFITKCNRIDYGFGHALAGHEQYMARYDRLNDEEKLQLYIKAEPTLSIYSETKTDAEYQNKIVKLEQSLEELQHKVNRMTKSNQ